MNQGQKRKQSPIDSGGGDKAQDYAELKPPDVTDALKKADEAIQKSVDAEKKNRREKSRHACCFD